MKSNQELPIYSEKIKNLLKNESNWTKQEELANYIGCDKTAISKIIKGKYTPTIIQLEKIAQYFEVSTDWLLDRGPRNFEWRYTEFLRKITENTKIYEKILDCFFYLVRYKTKADKDYYGGNTPIDEGYPTPEVAAHLYAHKIGMYVTEILDEYIDTEYAEDADIYSAVIEEQKEAIRNKQSVDEWLAYQHKFDGE